MPYIIMTITKTFLVCNEESRLTYSFDLLWRLKLKTVVGFEKKWFFEKYCATFFNIFHSSKCMNPKMITCKRNMIPTRLSPKCGRNPLGLPSQHFLKKKVRADFVSVVVFYDFLKKCFNLTKQLIF